MANPLLSIIVPIYNTEQFLPHCIESLINQRYKNIQIVLVNDGSTDDSLSVCRRFQEADNRIRVIDQPNQGVSKARNAGITAAEGEYIGFLDSDDFVAHEMYEELLRQIQLDGSQCAALINFSVRTPGKKYYETRVPISRQDAIGELFQLRFPTSMWAYLYKAELVRDIVLSEDIHFFEDFEFNYNVLKKCNVISVCNKDFYNYRQNPESINHQEINAKKISCLKIYKKLKSEIDELGDELAEKALYFRAHFIVSMILAFASSGSTRREGFGLQIRDDARGFFLKMIKAKYVPVTHKLVIISFSVWPWFATGMVNLAKKSRNYFR